MIKFLLLRTIKLQYLFITVSACCLLLGLLIERTLYTADYTKIAEDFEKALIQKDSQLEKLVQVTHSLQIPGSSNIKTWENHQGLNSSNQNDFTILIYEMDSLVYWSNNNVPVSKTFDRDELANGIIRLKNGWYNACIQENDDQKTIGLALIKHAFSFENKFLTNDFHASLRIPKGIFLTKERKKDSFPIKSPDGRILCYLGFDNSMSATSQKQFSLLWYLVFFLYLGFIISAVRYLEILISQLKDHFDNLSVIIVFVISILSLRMLLLVNQFPQLLYDLPAFSPSYYGTSFLFPSIGDFMLNAITIFYLSVYIYNNSRANMPDREKDKDNKVSLLLTSALKILAVLFGGVFISYLFDGLIINSTISYNINNLFELDYLSFIGYASMGFVLFAYYFFGETATLGINNASKNFLLILWSSSSLLFVAITYFFIYKDPWLVFWPPIFIGVLLAKSLISRDQKETQKPMMYPLISLIIVFASFTAHITNHGFSKKELAERKVLAEKLAAEFDPVAEYLYGDLEKALKNDKTLNSFTDSIADERTNIIEHIKDKHLRGFWEKYDVQITICQKGDSLLIENENITRGCNAFFNALIKEQGRGTINNNFHFLDNNNGRISYLAILSNDTVSIYFEMDLKIIPEARGFPELLLDIGISKHLSDALKVYSYAKYKGSKLMSQAGDFPYTSKLRNHNPNKNFYEYNIDGFNHLVYNVDDTTTIVLSKKEASPVDPIIRFSYLFAFFCCFAFIFIVVMMLPNKLINVSINFRRRIELSMVSVLLMSLLPISIGTKYYIEKQYNSRNHQNIKEKIQSVLIELEHKLADEKELNGDLKEYISYLLTKFSYVFFTDINLYDLEGNLIASSQPKIFEEGLISTKMDSEAYLQLAINEKTEFVHKEDIGTFDFLSAYIPFRNQDREVLAYLNLPYFAKQEEVKKEISTFFIALFNVYVVLILLSVIIALVVSNRITQPLRLMQSMLANVKLGSSNEPIAWNSKDEIGSLVKEYNRMLKELEVSAVNLAKSERESAWREMAKQVAHEIKNPLTPMKLSVQHLERAWKDKSPDWEIKLSQFSKTLVQQIDALSSIASEFSNFAKMPKTKRTVINLLRVIENTIDLFKESTLASISLQIDSSLQNQKLMVFADKEQLNQALNNLIKNAIQAIPALENGIIIVTISKKGSDYIIQVKDNGVGISESEHEKIFAPNFTTKTGGMGLGLALVKNMIENSGGFIWFESKKGEGSSFYFSLPIHQEE